MGLTTLAKSISSQRCAALQMKMQMKPRQAKVTYRIQQQQQETVQPFGCAKTVRP